MAVLAMLFMLSICMYDMTVYEIWLNVTEQKVNIVDIYRYFIIMTLHNRYFSHLFVEAFRT